MRGVLAALCLGALCAAFTAAAGSAYTAISPSAGDRSVTLTGRDLTIEQIVTHPPVAVFEILSPADTLRRLMAKCKMYEEIIEKMEERIKKLTL